MKRLRRLTNIDDSSYEDNDLDEYNISYLDENNISNIRDFINMSMDNIIHHVIYDNCNPYVILNKDKNIIYVSPAWEDLCLYRYFEVKNKDLSILQGKDTDMKKLKYFEKQLINDGYSETIVLNYKKDNSIFINNIKAIKIENKYDYYNINQKNIPYFVALLNNIPIT